MDLRFGMTKKEFYAHCWDLHKKGLVREGLGGASVHFELRRNNKTYDVNFYPNFYKDKIVSLPVEYRYAAFAPWNPKYNLDTLLMEVLQLYKEEYGDDFLEIYVERDGRGKTFVRVDGNRRISIYKDIVKNKVIVYFFDLLSPNVVV